MPAEYTIERHRIVVTLTGVATFAELRLVYAARQLDERFRNVRAELVDARGATNVRINSEQLSELQDLTLEENEHFRNVPLAIIATSQAVYGTARIFQAIADDDSRPLEIFRSLEEAERWLDQVVPPD